MLLSSAPVQIQLPFANGDSGKTNPVPVPSQIGVQPGRASFTDGFPPLCATPISSGGVPPYKSDMNGVLFMHSAIARWFSAGGTFQFSSAFATAIGGYPKGAVVLNAAANSLWLNLTDNNFTNPDTGSNPTGWVPVQGGVGSVYASVQRTLATGNSQVVFDTVEFDPYGFWNPGSVDFEAPFPGKFRLAGSLYLPSPAAQMLTVNVYKNGSLAKQCSQFPASGSGSLSYPFSATLNLASGDHAQVYMNVPTTPVLIGNSSGSSESTVWAQFEFLGS